MNNKNKIVVTIITTFCFVGMIVTLVLMVNWKKDVNTNSKMKEKTEEFIEIDEQDNIDINFEELKK